MVQAVCVHCKKTYLKNPRQKNQTYCSDPVCQRARKAKWQREKMKSDTVYKKDQKQANRDWQQKNPEYWKNYRRQHPEKSLRNTLLQRKRNHQRQVRNDNNVPDKNLPSSLIAKMDVLQTNNRAVLMDCWVVPVIAKMDVLRGYLSVNKEIPNRKVNLLSDCKDGRYSYSG